MKKIIAVVASGIFLVACNKEKQGRGFCSETAVVRWSGDPAADGLGWIIFDSVGGARSMVPRNLSNEYKIDNLPVSVCMVETDEKYPCECLQAVNKYQITYIRKR